MVSVIDEKVNDIV